VQHLGFGGNPAADQTTLLSFPLHRWTTSVPGWADHQKNEKAALYELHGGLPPR
jgi:hypothetical protein